MSTRPARREYERAAALLGRKVYEVRVARELTQEQLAEKAGISRNQIQNIENNRNNSKDESGRPGPGNARLDTVFALAAALKVDVTYLIDPKRAVLPLPE